MKQYENQLIVDLSSLDIAEGGNVKDHPVHVIGVAPHLEEEGDIKKFFRATIAVGGAMIK